MIKIIQAKTDFELVQVRNLRIKIFVIEQQIPWQWEFDIHDKNATHLIVLSSNEIIGTGRFYYDHCYGDYKLGRMAVLSNFRSQGIGSKILTKIEEIAKTKKVPKIYGIFKVVVWDCTIYQSIHLKKVNCECKSL